MGKKLAEHPIVVLIGFIASVIGIYMFISGKQNIRDALDIRLPVAKPTAFLTPTLIPVSGIFDVSFFFHWINYTGSKGTQFDDSMLLSAWDITTADFRCKEYAQCDYEAFRDFWLDWKVEATLYECSSNVVDAEQTYYPKNETSGLQPIGPFFRRYILIEEGGVLKINEAADIQGPCIFYLSKTMVTP